MCLKHRTKPHTAYRGHISRATLSPPQASSLTHLHRDLCNQAWAPVEAVVAVNDHWGGLWVWLQAVVLWLQAVVLWGWPATAVTIGAQCVLMEPAATRPHALTTQVADDQSRWAAITAAMALALVLLSLLFPFRCHGWRFTRVSTRLVARRLSHALSQECLITAIIN